MYGDYRIKPLHIMLSKTRVYVKIHNGQTKWMYFLTKDDDLLEKYNTIWDKVSADIKKEFFYNKAFLKTKIRSYSDEATGFSGKEMPKVGCNHTWLAVITIDSALEKEENYFSQVFLKVNTLKRSD